jgi:hypothetical protein
MRYVWRNGQFVSPKDNSPMPIPEREGVCAPRIQSDIPEYRSPIDGRPITSRTHRREDLKRNDCVEIDPPKNRRGYKNARFAAKHGLPLREDVAEKLKAA